MVAQATKEENKTMSSSAAAKEYFLRTYIPNESLCRYKNTRDIKKNLEVWPEPSPAMYKIWYARCRPWQLSFRSTWRPTAWAKCSSPPMSPGWAWQPRYGHRKKPAGSEFAPGAWPVGLSFCISRAEARIIYDSETTVIFLIIQLEHIKVLKFFLFQAPMQVFCVIAITDE